MISPPARPLPVRLYPCVVELVYPQNERTASKPTRKVGLVRLSIDLLFGCKPDSVVIAVPHTKRIDERYTSSSTVMCISTIQPDSSDSDGDTGSYDELSRYGRRNALWGGAPVRHEYRVTIFSRPKAFK